MAKYIYTVKTKDSKTVKGMLAANSRDEVIGRLRSKGLFIVSIEEEKQSAKRPSIFSFSQLHGRRNSIKLFDLTFFARNLSTTLSSGLTLLRSLEIIGYQAESIKLDKTLRKCCESIRNGLSFGEAISKYPDIFSPLWRGIVHVGETSGNLPFVLDKLADYLELRMEFERKIKSALIYPCILVCAAIFAIIIFLKFILPKFVIIFNQFNVKLPLPTRVIFGLSNFVSDYFLGIIIAGAGMIFLSFFLKDRPAVKNWWDRAVLKLPVIGQVMFAFFLERLTSTIYILLDSGLPVVYAIEITANSIGNSLFKESIAYVKERVKEGASLSDELSKINLFPLLVSEMARIG